METTMDNETKIEWMNRLLDILDTGIDQAIDEFLDEVYAEFDENENDVETFFTYAKERLNLMYSRVNERIEDEVCLRSQNIK